MRFSFTCPIVPEGKENLIVLGRQQGKVRGDLGTGWRQRFDLNQKTGEAECLEQPKACKECRNMAAFHSGGMETVDVLVLSDTRRASGQTKRERGH